MTLRTAIISVLLIPISVAVLHVVFFEQHSAAAQTTINWQRVDQAMGKAGTAQSGGVHRYSMPRSDLRVRIGPVMLKPNFALGSHAEFMQTGTNEVMVMGDLVLTEKEVGPVITKLLQGGIGVVALHNHLINESPKIMYLHIGARGNPVAIATAIHNALRQTRTPLSSKTAGNKAIANLDTRALDVVMKRTGSANNGIYQYSIPRKETIMDQGISVLPAMGVATGVNFQPLGKGRAAVTGDFVLVASEVNPVIQTLRASGIGITALHTHSLTETPRLFYLHFWGTGNAITLARGLSAAIDKTNSQ